MTTHKVIRGTLWLALFAMLGGATVACGPKGGAGGTATRTAPSMGTNNGTGTSTGTGTGTGTTTNPTNPTPGSEINGANPGTAVAPPPG